MRAPGEISVCLSIRPDSPPKKEAADPTGLPRARDTVRLRDCLLHGRVHACRYGFDQEPAHVKLIAVPMPAECGSYAPSAPSPDLALPASSLTNSKQTESGSSSKLKCCYGICSVRMPVLGGLEVLLENPKFYPTLETLPPACCLPRMPSPSSEHAVLAPPVSP